jgi:hypothetical protein
MPPFRPRASFTESPSARLACFAIARGIRTAKLFPHFAILDSFRICLYFEYTTDPQGEPRAVLLDGMCPVAGTGRLPAARGFYNAW